MRKAIIKKENGSALIEVMASAVLLLLITIGYFQFLHGQNTRATTDEVAYTTALIIEDFSRQAYEFIEDNADQDIPERIDKAYLVSKGYMDNDLTIDETPLGYRLVIYTNMDYGFPLTTGVFMEGEGDEDVLKRYRLDNEARMGMFRQRVSTYLSGLMDDTVFRFGNISADYELQWTADSKFFSLEDYINENKTSLDDTYTNVLFFNFQKDPGYWVLNYDTTAYNTYTLPNAGIDNPDHTVFSLGYSDFCPSPGIKPTTDTFNNTFVYGGEKKVNRFDYHDSGTQAYKNYQMYICLPATKISVDNSYKQFSLINQYYGDKGYNSCRSVPTDSRVYMYGNIVEFAIGKNEYTFYAATGFTKMRCYGSWTPLMYGGFIKYGGAPSNNMDLSFYMSESWTIDLPNVSVKEIRLK